MGKTSCSRKLLVCTNSFIALVGAAVLVICILALLTNTLGFLAAVPVDAMTYFISLGGFMFLVALTGLLGLLVRSRCFMYCYICYTLIGLSVMLVFIPFFIVAANDIGTDSAVGDALDGAQVTIENAIVDWAKDNAKEWRDVQDGFDCCGVSFPAAITVNKTEDYTLTKHLSGAECEKGLDTVLVLMGTQKPTPEIPYEVKNLTTEQLYEAAANDKIIGDDAEFFCIDNFIGYIVVLTIPISAGAGVIAILLCLNVRAAFVVLYRIPEYMGGFVSNDEFDDYEEKPKGRRKKSKKPMASQMDDDDGAYKMSTPDYGRGGGGGAPSFGKAKFNFGGGRDDDDDVPRPNAGFGGPGGGGGFGGAMNRMSKKVFNNDFFNPPPRPKSGAPKPMDDFRAFGNRVSKKFGGFAPIGEDGGGGGFGNRVSKKFGFGGGSGFGSSGGFGGGNSGGGGGSMFNRMSRGFKPPSFGSFGSPPSSSSSGAVSGFQPSGGPFGGGRGTGGRGAPPFGRSSPPGGGTRVGPPVGFDKPSGNNFVGSPPTMGRQGGFGGGPPTLGGPGGGPSLGGPGAGSRGGMGGARGAPSGFGGGGRGPPPARGGGKKKGGGGFFGRKQKGPAPSAVGGGDGKPKNLLAQIQKGKRLNNVQTNDRSGPEFQGRVL